MFVIVACRVYDLLSIMQIVFVRWGANVLAGMNPDEPKRHKEERT